MKKLWLIVALAALGGLAINSYADVQNIRLSGDIRIRGYYLNETDPVDDPGSDSFVSQRTRVTVEADLEDHILVVVTLKAEGLWGDDNTSADDAGAGQDDSASSTDNINRSWDVGFDEAYVQLNEIFYTPATLKLGRQYLNYGHGLILSSIEQEYNYDAARIVLDLYPLTIDVVGASIVENSNFGAGDITKDSELIFANARYEFSGSIIKNVEAYFGYLNNSAEAYPNGGGSSTRVPPGTGGASPLLIGVRGDLSPTEGLKMWFEGAYEFGSGGVGAPSLSAWLANAGFQYAFKNVSWSPTVNFNYTLATGGVNSSGEPDNNQFVPWFTYVEGYNGYLFHPLLTNINIFNAGASVKPAENTTLSVQGYYYSRFSDGAFAGQDPNVDWGNGFGLPNSSDGPLGWEIDGILGYDYSKDVRAQLVYAAFIPESGYNESDGTGGDLSQVAQEVRVEIDVRF